MQLIIIDKLQDELGQQYYGINLCINMSTYYRFAKINFDTTI